MSSDKEIASLSPEEAAKRAAAIRARPEYWNPTGKLTKAEHTALVREHVALMGRAVDDPAEGSLKAGPGAGNSQANDARPTPDDSNSNAPLSHEDLKDLSHKDLRDVLVEAASHKDLSHKDLRNMVLSLARTVGNAAPGLGPILGPITDAAADNVQESYRREDALAGDNTYKPTSRDNFIHALILRRARGRP